MIFTQVALADFFLWMKDGAVAPFTPTRKWTYIDFIIIKINLRFYLE